MAVAAAAAAPRLAFLGLALGLLLGSASLVLRAASFSPPCESPARATPLLPRGPALEQRRGGAFSGRRRPFCAHAHLRSPPSETLGAFAFSRGLPLQRKSLAVVSSAVRPSFQRLSASDGAAEAAEASPPEAAGRVGEVFKQIQQLTLIEASELVRLLEKTFGVSAAVQTAVVAAPSSSPSDAENENAKKEEASPPPKKDKLTLTLLAVPTANRIAVIKTLRTLRSDLGLKEAKAFIDALPNVVLKDAPNEAATKAFETLKAAGAELNLE